VNVIVSKLHISKLKVNNRTIVTVSKSMKNIY